VKIRAYSNARERDVSILDLPFRGALQKTLKAKGVPLMRKKVCFKDMGEVNYG